jgi:hypothetical protein
LLTSAFPYIGDVRLYPTPATEANSPATTVIVDVASDMLCLLYATR